MGLPPSGRQCRRWSQSLFIQPLSVAAAASVADEIEGKEEEGQAEK